MVAVALLATAAATSGRRPADRDTVAVRVAREAAPGAAGVGDPYFPTYGNGGYDVASYDLKVRYDPATDRLTGHGDRRRHRDRRRCPASTSTSSGSTCPR